MLVKYINWQFSQLPLAPRTEINLDQSFSVNKQNKACLGGASGLWIERHFTSLKKRTRVFRRNRFLRILMDSLSETKGFLPKVFEIFWNEMPLALQSRKNLFNAIIEVL